MRLVIAVVVLLMLTACASSKPDGREPIFPSPLATYGDQTRLVGEGKLTYQFALVVWQAGDIKDLQAWVSCEIRREEAKVREAEVKMALHEKRHEGQRLRPYPDYYQSAMARKRAGALERLTKTQWLAYYAKLRIDQPCTEGTSFLAERFYKNHMAGKYQPTDPNSPIWTLP